MEEHWYKEAIIYELHVKCFYDSSGDGVGDFKGLTQKLDYLLDLGVTAIWLLPFYPSPLKDDGYDISNYTDVHPHYGELKDFRDFLKQAHARGLKVITEFVLNHTSDQHPWFQKARKAGEQDPEREFYVWSDSPQKYRDARIIFQDFEPSNWTWDAEAQSYFWHRFYAHQPDLNYENPAVHKAILKNLAFWFKMGVDGMRLDAVPYLYERDGTNCENLPETHAFLKKLRLYLDTHFKDRMLLAEANQWPEDAAEYFGAGDECHMAFHFPVMPRLFMAIHLEDSLPIIDIMNQTPSIPENCQWALFLRNHDELTLEMVTDEERDYMFRVYAYHPQARLNLGIRRRLAPLLKNDRRKIELMKVLLFSLHGTPVLYYGDELGMGDNIFLGDRNGVRTPMQWSNDRNAGFSRANPQQLYLPPIIDPEYHYETVNVEAQLNNPHSLLWWTKQLIALRKKYKAFSYGNTEFLKVRNRKVLVFFRECNEELIMIITNLSRFPQYVELDLKKYNGYSLIEMFSGERFPSIGELPYFLTLGSYGYYWFALEKQHEEISAELERKRERQVAEIRFKTDPEKLFLPAERKLLESIVKKYLFKRIWFHPILERLERTKLHICDHFVLGNHEKLHTLLIKAELINGVIYHIPLILKILEGEKAREKINSNPEEIVTIVKYADRVSVVEDCGLQNSLSDIFLQMVWGQKKYHTENGRLRGIRINSTDEKSSIKLFNPIDEGMDLDVEMRLFLSDKTDFNAFLPLMGYIEYLTNDKAPLTLAVIVPEKFPLQNAKDLFTEAAEHFLQRVMSGGISLKEGAIHPNSTFIKLTEKTPDQHLIELMEEQPEIAYGIGNTTAEFHMAMHSSFLDPAFSPIPYTLFYQRSLFQTIRRKVNDAFARLRQMEAFSEMYPLQERILKRMHVLTTTLFQVLRIRYHGNYVLENLFYTGKDFIITNFGGDIKLPYAERRYKRCPLRDTISMQLSIYEAGFEAVEKLELQGLIANREWSLKWITVWALWMGSFMLKTYLKKLSESLILPQKKHEVDLLLGIFFLELCLEKIADKEIANPEMYCQLFKHWLGIYEKIK